MKALELPDTTLPSGALSSSQASLIASAEGAAGAHADGRGVGGGSEKSISISPTTFLFFSFFPLPALLQPATQIYNLILRLMLSGPRTCLDGLARGR